MKKSFSELKNLIEPYLWERVSDSPDEKFEIEWVEPQTLISPYRFDLPIKIKYVEAYDKGWDTKFFFEMYKSHIRAFTGGSYTEYHNHEKNSFDLYIKTFHELIDAVKKNGLDEKISVVPVGGNGAIINGAHRTSTSIYFNKKIPIVRFPQINVDFGSFFFAQLNLESEYLDYAAATLLEMLNRKNLHVALFWARANIPDKIQQAEKILAEETEVVYAKILQSDYNLVRNLIITCYSGTKDDWWLGSAENDFYGADGKAHPCHLDGGRLRVYFFYSKDSTDLVQLKDKIRDIFQLGKQSIHITDTPAEAETLTKIFLNRNSVDLMKYGNPYRQANLISRLKDVREKFFAAKVPAENFIIDSSSVLGLYGLRAVGDTDYITLPQYERNFLIRRGGGRAGEQQKIFAVP